VLAVHILRAYSLALGALTVVLIWGIVTWIYPRQHVLPLAAAAVAAYIPQYLFISSSVNNDNAAVCLATLSLLLLLVCLRRGVSERENPGRLGAMWVALGVALGLALLAKLSAVGLLLPTAIVVALVIWHQRSWRTLWLIVAAVGVPVALIAGWWYARNVHLYGEPTGLSAMWEVVGRRDDFGQGLWGEFRGVRYSFWGLFGWFSIIMPDWTYRLLDLLSVAALFGLAFEATRWVRHGSGRDAWISFRRREPGWGSAYRPVTLALLSLWLVTVFVSLVRWTSWTSGSQGRLLYVAIACFSLLIVLGIRAWLPSDGMARDAVGVALSLSMLALSIAAAVLWVRPPYERPAQISDLPPDAVPLDLTYGDAVVLRGVGLEQKHVRPGETLIVRPYWETKRSLADDPGAMIWLRLIKESPEPGEAAGGVVGLEDSYPGSGTFPTVLWPVGPVLVGRQYVRLGEDTPAPMVARLDLALYDEETGQNYATSSSDLPTIGRVKVIPWRWPDSDRDELLARFDCGVSLVTSDHQAATPLGEMLPVTLTWTVQSAPGRDYTVFLHLEDGAGKVWGYGDGAPRGGNYPTWAWEPGEVVTDERGVAVATDVPPGHYHLRAGLYDERGRVPAYDASGARLPDDAVDLGMVEVK
jgi:hypothetical protein